MGQLREQRWTSRRPLLESLTSLSLCACLCWEVWEYWNWKSINVCAVNTTLVSEVITAVSSRFHLCSVIELLKNENIFLFTCLGNNIHHTVLCLPQWVTSKVKNELSSSLTDFIHPTHPRGFMSVAAIMTQKNVISSLSAEPKLTGLLVPQSDHGTLTCVVGLQPR